MFVDSVIIWVASGKGGDGIVHMHREKYRAKGGPDGGDGGRGGDIVFEVVPTLNTLNRFHYNERFQAESGKPGGPSNRSGKSAPDLTIAVPPGTLIYNDETAELIGDLVTPGQKLIVAKGGRGGRGNQHFATSRQQVPLTAEKGEPGEEFTLRLELKLIADVGLVGMPNAGKSSILAASTRAKPKIANYPFTTLFPNLGVVELNLDTTMVLADIPGLIEGASEGVGLGHDFLRHVQRTRVLIHVLDGMSEDPLQDFEIINNELEFFDEHLSRSPQVLVLNKMDLPDVQEKYEHIAKSLQEQGVELMPVSAATGLNMKELMWKAYQVLQDTPIEESQEELPVYRADEDPRAFEIEQIEDDTWLVTGKLVEKSAAMTHFDQPGSVRRFQRLLERLGVEKALRNDGIQEGDTVVIGEWELVWWD